MKTRTETISVTGQDYKIEFEFINHFEPIEISSVNGIPSVNFVEEFIMECKRACAQFLREEAMGRKEALAEAMGDSERGN